MVCPAVSWRFIDFQENAMEQYALFEDYPEHVRTMMFEITAESELHKYCPVKESKLKAVLSGKGLNYIETEDQFAALQRYFIQTVKASLRQDTIVIFPAYFSAKSGRPNMTCIDKHISLFSNYISCMTSTEGERPRILCMRHNYESFRDIYTGDFIKGRSSAMPSSQIPIEDETVNAKHLLTIAEGVKYWLKSHPEIRNIVSPSMELLSILFPDSDFPVAFKNAALRLFKGTLSFGAFDSLEHREYTFTAIPSMLKYVKYGDGILDVTADMLSYIFHPAEQPEVKSVIIDNMEQIEKIKAKAKAAQIPISLDFETTGLNPKYYDQHIISCHMSNGNVSWGFLVNHPRYPEKNGMPMVEAMMDDPEMTLIIQNAVYDTKWYMAMTGKFPKAKIYDTMLLDHWLNETLGSTSLKAGMGGAYSMDLQIPRYLHYSSHKPMLDEAMEKIEFVNPYKAPSASEIEAFTVKEVRQLVDMVNDPHRREPNSGKYAGLSYEMLFDYGNSDAAATWRIFDKQRQKITEQCGEKWPRVIEELMPKLIYNTARMENTGAPLNYDMIIEKIKDVNLSAKQCKDRVEEATHYQFDLNSPKQLLDYLTKHEKIDPEMLYSVKKDDICVDIETLGRFEKTISWMPDFLSYKKAMKLKNTYLIPIVLKSCCGTLYFGIDLTGTVTGRLASRNPNIQNLPKALKICGKKVGLKEVIQAPDGHIFSDMDLSSAEVKVLTVVCPDEKLVDVLKRGLDAHSYTASLVSQTSPNPKSYEEIYHSHQKADHVIDEPMTEEDGVNEALRKNAKRVTFGAIYRIGKQGLATQLVYKYNEDPKLSFKQNQLERQKVGEVIAQDLLDKLFNEVYPTLGKSFERSDFNVFNRHYGESIFGRRRRYTHSVIPMVNHLFLGTGLYSKEGHSILSLADSISFIPSQRCFRQNVNFEVQSPTSDYMQFYINYILTRCSDIPDFNFHLTVHDSALFSFVDTKENYDKFKKVCDYGMDVYLKSLDDRLPVTIGYGMDTAYNYCKIS